MPLYMLQIYDRVLASRSLETLLYLSIIAGAALVVLGLLEIVRGIYASRVAARLDIELSPMAIRLAMISPQAAMGDTQPLRDVGAIRSFIGSRDCLSCCSTRLLPLSSSASSISSIRIFSGSLWWALSCSALLALLNQFATSKATGMPTSRASRPPHRGAGAGAFVGSRARVMGMSDNVDRTLGRTARDDVAPFGSRCVDQPHA